MNIANIGVGLFTDLSRLHSGLQQGESAVRVFASAATAALTAVGGAAIAAGLAMDDALDSIRVSTGRTGESLERLEGSFKRVFAGVPSSAADAATAIRTLNARTGQSGVGLERLSAQVLTLSRITGSDLKQNLEGSARVFNAWNIAANQQSASLDILFRTHQQTGVGITALVEAMDKAGPVFRAAGFDFARSAALIGGFEKAGVNGQRALASFTAAFRYFSNEGQDASEGLKQTIARIQELGPGAAASALGVKVFGRSAVDMIAAIHSGRLNVDALVASISSGSETIMGAAKATDGFAETLVKARSKLVLLLEPMGTRILSVFNAGLEAAIAPGRALIGVLNGLAQAAIALAAAVTARLVVSLIASTRAKVADVLAAQAARVANVQLTGAVAAQAQAQFLAATAALNAARAETALTGSVVAQRAALNAVATAHAQATAATAAHTAAMSAASVSARLAAGSVNLLKGALALFGGPWGLAITAVLTAIGVAFFRAGKKAREAAADARVAADEFRSALAGMDEATFTATAAATRAQYRAYEQMTAQQRRMIEAQRAEVARMRSQETPASGFAAGKGIVQVSEELRTQESLLTTMQGNLTHLANRWAATAANVRAVKEQEAALAAQQRAGLVGGNGTGPLDWEGDDSKETWWDALAKRAQTIRAIFDGLRTQQKDASGAGEVLVRVMEDAQSRLASLGNTMSGELAEARSVLLRLISDIQSVDGLGFKVRADVRMPNPSAGVAVPFLSDNTRLRSDPLQRAQNRAAAQDAYWREESRRQAERLASLRAEIPIRERIRAGMVEFGELGRYAAETAREAKGLWASLLNGIPQQVANFADAFRTVRELRFARNAAGQDNSAALFRAVGRLAEQVGTMIARVPGLGGAGNAVKAAGASVGGIGLAPFPAAIAFMVAAEALAPILEALKEPFAALMVPIQMLATAFGPLLTSLLKAFFPIFKQFGIGITYLAQVVGWIGGAIFKVVGEVIRAIGSLIKKIPGLGEEGRAIQNFGKGMSDASKEMFEMAKAMPGVRDELRNLDWDEAMERAADGANKLADSLTNVPAVFDLIARRTQAMRGIGPNVVTQPSPVSPGLNLAPSPGPSPSSESGGHSVKVENHLTIAPGAFIVNGGDPATVAAQLRRFKEELVQEMNMPGSSRLQRAVVTAVRNASNANI